MNRIVVKIGTKVLTAENGTLDAAFLERLVAQIAELRRKGVQVVVVTSGAVGAGKSLVSLEGIESETVQKQVYAAVGQVTLMQKYAELFAAHGFLCAQVLATKEDFRDEAHYLNMKNCFEGLLLDNVVPVVNENDVVATTELLFTDNDELAGLVATQLGADRLIILTTTNGILDKYGSTIPEINSKNAAQAAQYVTSDTSTGGRGGMASKFSVALGLLEKGIVTHIVEGRREKVLLEIAEGQVSGTKFAEQ